MPKENISATVDPEVAEYLGQETVNCSGVVNRAVKREMGILEESDSELVKLRLEQIRDDRKDLEERANRKAEMEERLESRLKKDQREEREALQEAINQCLESFRYLPDDHEDPAIQNHASNVGVTPERFYDELAEAWDDA